jgi:hypothetical protein
MEVAYLPDDPFDLSRLTECERRLWDEYFAESDEAIALRLWAFGQACMLECEGPPAVIAERLCELDPDNRIGQYVENVRRARERGDL